MKVGQWKLHRTRAHEIALDVSPSILIESSNESKV